MSVHIRSKVYRWLHKKTPAAVGIFLKVGMELILQTNAKTIVQCVWVRFLVAAGPKNDGHHKAKKKFERSTLIEHNV